MVMHLKNISLQNLHVVQQYILIIFQTKFIADMLACTRSSAIFTYSKHIVSLTIVYIRYVDILFIYDITFHIDSLIFFLLFFFFLFRIVIFFS